MQTTSPSALPFSKLVGTGNDFVFLDARQMLPAPWASFSRPELARRLCDRHFGVGADGLVFVQETAGQFSWDFYNSDGSSAEMCGNATRCMGRWAEQHLGKKQIEFRTLSGLVKTQVEDGAVASRLEFVHARPRAIAYSSEREEKQAFLLDTGVPHAVRVVRSLESAQKQMSDIAALRFHADAGVRGANVTLLEIQRPDFFRTVTFERGVEGFTLSCGTGVLAAAAVGLMQNGRESGSVELSTPGGNLFVDYSAGFKGVTLRGPAAEIFRGTLDTNAYEPGGRQK